MCVRLFVFVVVAFFAAVPVVADQVTSALCRTNCINEFLETEPKTDRDCAINPDCFLCWEHCGLLSKNNASKDSLCQDDKCSEGCEVACIFFRSKRQLPKERLVFPNEPVLNDDTLEWGPVPKATLYSISLVYLNRTMLNIAQTVTCKLKIPKPQLMKVVRIVLIAVNKSGALGLTNFNIVRRIIKKNVSTTLSKIKDVIDPNVSYGLPSSSLTPALWVVQGITINLDGTLGKTNISWQYMNTKKPDMSHDFLVKWWTPDLNMEGRIVVNGSNSVELTYLFKFFSFVKVKVIGMEEESQILVLKNNKEEFLTIEHNVPNHWLMFLCLNLLVLFFVILLNSIGFFRSSAIKLGGKTRCYTIYE